MVQRFPIEAGRERRRPGPALRSGTVRGLLWAGRPHLSPMDAPKETRGFTFPGIFEVTAFGPARPDLDAIVLRELAAAGVRPDPSTVRRRPSRAGNYVAVAVGFWCEDRDLYEDACARLRAHPAVKWTL